MVRRLTRKPIATPRSSTEQIVPSASAVTGRSRRSSSATAASATSLATDQISWRTVEPLSMAGASVGSSAARRTISPPSRVRQCPSPTRCNPQSSANLSAVGRSSTPNVTASIPVMVPLASPLIVVLPSSCRSVHLLLRSSCSGTRVDARAADRLPYSPRRRWHLEMAHAEGTQRVQDRVQHRSRRADRA